MKVYICIVILFWLHGQMEEIRIPMMRGNMDDIGDEEVKLKTYMYPILQLFLGNASICSKQSPENT